jgi:predicted phosphodiesterase
MRAAVLSDSHGNLELLERALSLARDEGPLDIVFHLGDEHTDIDGLLLGGEKHEVVPGIYHKDYLEGTLNPFSIVELDDLVIAMAHQLSDLPKLESCQSPRLFMHGHTHCLSLTQYPWGLTFNPGHLSRPRDKGRQASFGCVSITEDLLTIEGTALAGRRVLHSEWQLHDLRREQRT